MDELFEHVGIKPFLRAIVWPRYNLPMTVLRAHFDGKVFVPDKPVDLPPGNVTLQVIELDMDIDPLTGLSIIRVPPGTKTISLEDVRRALEEDD